MLTRWSGTHNVSHPTYTVWLTLDCPLVKEDRAAFAEAAAEMARLETAAPGQQLLTLPDGRQVGGAAYIEAMTEHCTKILGRIAEVVQQRLEQIAGQVDQHLGKEHVEVGFDHETWRADIQYRCWDEQEAKTLVAILEGDVRIGQWEVNLPGKKIVVDDSNTPVLGGQ